MGTTRLKNGTPGRNRWTRSTGLGIAAASGHESAPIQWAWVSGDPAGIESEAGRRALSQRRAGGHWVSCDPVAWSPANGAPGGAATREPAGGLGRATAGGRYLPRSAGMRASWPLDLRRSRRTPTPSCSGLWRDYERRLPCRGTISNPPNSDPCQIITPLVLVGLGLGVGEGLGLGVGLGLGNHIAISTRGVIIWQGVENGHNTGLSTKMTFGSYASF